MAKYNPLLEAIMKAQYRESNQSQYNNKYDDGSVWDKAPTTNQNPYWRVVGSTNPLLNSFKGTARYTQNDDLYDRASMNYYTDQLGKLGVEPEEPDSYNNKETGGSFLSTVGKALAVPMSFGNAISGITEGMRQVNNKQQSALEDTDAYKKLKSMGYISDGMNLYDSSGKKVLDIEANKLLTEAQMQSKNTFSLDSLKTIGKESVKSFINTYKSAFGDTDYSEVSDYANVLNRQDNEEGDIGAISRANTDKTLIAKSLSTLGVNDESARKWSNGIADVGMSAVMSAFDLNDVGKTIKYLNKADDVEKAFKVANNSQEAYKLAKSTMKLDEFADTYRASAKLKNQAEPTVKAIRKAYTKFIDDSATTLMNKTSKTIGGMNGFEGLKLGNKTIVSREDLNKISKSKIQSGLAKAGLSIYSPIGAVVNLPSGSIGQKLAHTELGTQMSDNLTSMFGGKNSQYAVTAKKAFREGNTDKIMTDVQTKYADDIFSRSKKINNMYADKVANEMKKSGANLSKISSAIENTQKFVSERVLKGETVNTKYVNRFKKYVNSQLKNVNASELSSLNKELQELESIPKATSLNFGKELDKIGLGKYKKLFNESINMDLETLTGHLRASGVTDAPTVANKLKTVGNNIIKAIEESNPNLSKHLKGSKDFNFSRVATALDYDPDNLSSINKQIKKIESQAKTFAEVEGKESPYFAEQLKKLEIEKERLGAKVTKEASTNVPKKVLRYKEDVQSEVETIRSKIKAQREKYGYTPGKKNSKAYNSLVAKEKELTEELMKDLPSKPKVIEETVDDLSKFDNVDFDSIELPSKKGADEIVGGTVRKANKSIDEYSFTNIEKKFKAGKLTYDDLLKYAEDNDVRLTNAHKKAFIEGDNDTKKKMIDLLKNKEAFNKELHSLDNAHIESATEYATRQSEELSRLKDNINVSNNYTSGILKFKVDPDSANVVERIDKFLVDNIKTLTPKQKSIINDFKEKITQYKKIKEDVFNTKQYTKARTDIVKFFEDSGMEAPDNINDAVIYMASLRKDGMKTPYLYYGNKTTNKTSKIQSLNNLVSSGASSKTKATAKEINEVVNKLSKNNGVQDTIDKEISYITRRVDEINVMGSKDNPETIKQIKEFIESLGLKSKYDYTDLPLHEKDIALKQLENAINRKYKKETYQSLKFLTDSELDIVKKSLSNKNMNPLDAIDEEKVLNAVDGTKAGWTKEDVYSNIKDVEDSKFNKTFLDYDHDKDRSKWGGEAFDKADKDVFDGTKSEFLEYGTDVNTKPKSKSGLDKIREAKLKHLENIHNNYKNKPKNIKVEEVVNEAPKTVETPKVKEVPTEQPKQLSLFDEPVVEKEIPVAPKVEKEVKNTPLSKLQKEVAVTGSESTAKNIPTNIPSTDDIKNRATNIQKQLKENKYNIKGLTFDIGGRKIIVDENTSLSDLEKVVTEGLLTDTYIYSDKIDVLGSTLKQGVYLNPKNLDTKDMVKTVQLHEDTHAFQIKNQTDMIGGEDLKKYMKSLPKANQERINRLSEMIKLQGFDATSEELIRAKYLTGYVNKAGKTSVQRTKRIAMETDAIVSQLLFSPNKDISRLALEEFGQDIKNQYIEKIFNMADKDYGNLKKVYPTYNTDNPVEILRSLSKSASEVLEQEDVKILQSALAEASSDSIKNVDNLMKQIESVKGIDPEAYKTYMRNMSETIKTYDYVTKAINIDMSKSLTPKEFEIYNHVKDEFTKFGLQEGLIKEGQEELFTNYCYHMLNPDIAVNEEALKVAQETFGKTFNDVFNVNGLTRKYNGTIEEINARMNKKMPKGSEKVEFFKTNIADIYMNRAVNHNGVMYKTKKQNYFIENYATKIEGTVKEDLNKYLETGEYIVVSKKAGKNYDALETNAVGNALKNQYDSYLIKANDWSNYEKLVKSTVEKDTNAFLKIYDKYMSLYKSMALASGRFVTNSAYGNIFESYMTSGVNLLEPKMIKKYMKYKSGADVKFGNYTSQDIAHAMQMFGVTETEASTDILKTGSKLKDKFQAIEDTTSKSILNGATNTTKKSPLQKLSKVNPLSTEFGLYKGIGKIQGGMEEMSRFINVATHLDSGKSMAEAIELTQKALFDYSDLSSFETDVMKRLIPFYTFTRNNLPLQLDNLSNNASKQRLLIKANDKLNREQSDKANAVRPDYLSDAIPIGEGKFLNFPNPIAELENILKPGNFAKSLTPAIKSPIEAMTKKNLTFGSDLNDSEVTEQVIKSSIPLVNTIETAIEGVKNNDYEKVINVLGLPIKTVDIDEQSKIALKKYVTQLSDQYYELLEKHPEYKEQLQNKTNMPLPERGQSLYEILSNNGWYK